MFFPKIKVPLLIGYSTLPLYLCISLFLRKVCNCNNETNAFKNKFTWSHFYKYKVIRLWPLLQILPGSHFSLQSSPFSQKENCHTEILCSWMEWLDHSWVLGQISSSVITSWHSIHSNGFDVKRDGADRSSTYAFKPGLQATNPKHADLMYTDKADVLAEKFSSVLKWARLVG